MRFIFFLTLCALAVAYFFDYPPFKNGQLDLPFLQKSRSSSTSYNIVINGKDHKDFFVGKASSLQECREKAKNYLKTKPDLLTYDCCLERGIERCAERTR